MAEIELIGAKELSAFLKQMPDMAEKDLDVLLFDMAAHTHETAVSNIQGGGRSGRVYRRKGKTHQASAAGEYPKSDTGTLARSTTLEREAVANYTVGSRSMGGKGGAPYGLWLEFGTRNMAKRPWLSRAFDATLRKFGSRLK